MAVNDHTFQTALRHQERDHSDAPYIHVDCKECVRLCAQMVHEAGLNVDEMVDPEHGVAAVFGVSKDLVKRLAENIRKLEQEPVESYWS